MATNTTNFNLKKPAYTDTADIADINGNMDKVDVSLNGLADAIAIVANNNTHAAITAGQYVYVHGHGTLAEGLYTAKSNIAANATLSTSNLQADGSGGLNALNSNISSVIDTSSTITGLHDGMNAIVLNGGVTIGNVTTQNKSRGYAVKDGGVIIGFTSNYQATEFYTLGASGANSWQSCKAWHNT